MVSEKSKKQDDLAWGCKDVLEFPAWGNGEGDKRKKRRKKICLKLA
jgi:hypothetical protein